eukprot:11659565-Prorocentrum_lima.AAC.1
MTSSLVGSEMCIRDRATLVNNLLARDVRRSCRAFDAGRSPEWFVPLAVSYTHLTLPTICSV